MLPVVGMAVFCGIITALSEGKAEAAFGSILLVEVFAPIYIVLGRGTGDPESRSGPEASIWSA